MKRVRINIYFSVYICCVINKTRQKIRKNIFIYFITHYLVSSFYPISYTLSSLSEETRIVNCIMTCLTLIENYSSSPPLDHMMCRFRSCETRKLTPSLKISFSVCWYLNKMRNAFVVDIRYSPFLFSYFTLSLLHNKISVFLKNKNFEIEIFEKPNKRP